MKKRHSIRTIGIAEQVKREQELYKAYQEATKPLSRSITLHKDEWNRIESDAYKLTGYNGTIGLRHLLKKIASGELVIFEKWHLSIDGWKIVDKDGKVITV